MSCRRKPKLKSTKRSLLKFQDAAIRSTCSQHYGTISRAIQEDTHALRGATTDGAASRSRAGYVLALMYDVLSVAVRSSRKPVA